MTSVVPVILAGGIGERFWPMSRSTMPKQLLPLLSDKTMLEETLARVKPFCTKKIAPCIVTSHSIAPLVKKSLGSRYAYQTIIEPVGKNSAPAIAAAAARILKYHGDAVMLVLSADHRIQPPKAFHAAVRHAAAIADAQEQLVVFGIPPTRPDTGYGYVRLGKQNDSNGAILSFKSQGFVEKPDTATAKKYVSSKKYLWNGGMFVWKASVIMAEFDAHMPVLAKQARILMSSRFSQRDVDAFYTAAAKESIDYGIMEKSSKVTIVQGCFSWDDIGSWESIARLNPANASGTVASGKQIVCDDAQNTIVVNRSGLTIAAVGVSDLVVVATNDAVCIIPRSRLGDIKKYITSMKNRADIPPELF
jgi:mannose-1-phosphate guanylyltransferase/mannose-6-phosphate isomerase